MEICRKQVNMGKMIYIMSMKETEDQNLKITFHLLN